MSTKYPVVVQIFIIQRETGASPIQLITCLLYWCQMPPNLRILWLMMNLGLEFCLQEEQSFFPELMRCRRARNVDRNKSTEIVQSEELA